MHVADTDEAYNGNRWSMRAMRYYLLSTPARYVVGCTLFVEARARFAISVREQSAMPRKRGDGGWYNGLM